VVSQPEIELDTWKDGADRELAGLKKKTLAQLTVATLNEYSDKCCSE